MRTLCFDLDGTLCTNTFGDYQAAQPFRWAIERVADLSAAGHRIVILTARGSATGIDWEQVTRGQLEEWGVAYDELRFGKPSADVYVDDRAVNAEAWRRGDAFTPPGFGRRGSSAKSLPAVLPPAVTSVVEVGRTFAGAASRLEAHADRVWALASAVGLRPAASRSTLIAEACESLAGASAGEELVYAVCLSDSGHMAFADGWTESADELRVSCRPLRQSAAALAPWLADESGPLGLAVHAALASAPARPSWRLTSQRGRVVDRLGGHLAVVRDGNLIVDAATDPAPIPWRWAVDLAIRIGLEPTVAPVEVRDLRAADEAFVIGMPFCVMPLASIDGRELEGVSGQAAQRLLGAWSEEAGIDLAGQLWELAGAVAAA